MHSNYVLPSDALKTTLNEIIQYYRKDEENDAYSDSEAPTFSHHLRTGRYYRGNHAHVLNYGITNKLLGVASTDTPEMTQVKQHMIALIERIAIIDPAALDELQVITNNPESNLHLKELLIDRYERLADQKYGALKQAADSYRDGMLKHYSNFSPHSHNHLQGYGSHHHETVKNILTRYIQCLFTNNEEQAKALKQEIINNHPQIKIGELTFIAQDCAHTLNQRKAILDKQFRDYKIDLNRLVQSATTDEGDRIALNKKANVSSNYNEYFSSAYETHLKQKNDTEAMAKKTADRKLKNKIDWASYIIALLLGLGEASVAAAGILTIGTFVCAYLPVVGVYLLSLTVAGVLASGFYANFNLVQQDTVDVLRSIFLKKNFWEDDKKKTVNGLTAICVGVFGIFLAVCSGASYAALSDKSLISNLISYVPLHLAYAVGLVIGIPTGLGLAVIFSVAIAGFIKNKGWNGMLTYLNKEFYMSKELRKDLSYSDLAKYYALACLKMLRLALVAALTLTIVVAARVVFTEQMATIVGNTASQLLGWGNAFVMGVFGSKKIQQALGGITPLGVVESVAQVVLGAFAFLFMVLETAARLTLMCLPFASVQEIAPVKTLRLFGDGCDAIQKGINWLRGGEARPKVFDLKDASAPSTTAAVSASLAETPAVNPKPTQTRMTSLQKCVAASQAANQFGEKLGLLLNTGGQMTLFASNPSGYSTLSLIGGSDRQHMAAVALAEAAYSQAPNADELRKVNNRQKIDIPADLPIYYRRAAAAC